MALPWKKKSEWATLAEQHYADGNILHRADDFHEKVQLILLDPIAIDKLALTIERNIPDAFSFEIFAPKNGSAIYLFSDQWKSIIQIIPVNDDVCSYRFWFAEPALNLKAHKNKGIHLEMNAAATAVEKTFLQFNKAAQVAMTYESVKNRQFEIGPRSYHGNLPDLTKFLEDNPLGSLAYGRAKHFVIDTSFEVIADYMTEIKNSNKLGFDAISDYLAVRFLNTPACPVDIQQHFSLAQQKSRTNQRAESQPKKFCHMCGKELSADAAFCRYCGTQISDLTIGND